jgi:hypothetical protein
MAGGEEGMMGVLVTEAVILFSFLLRKVQISVLYPEFTTRGETTSMKTEMHIA